MSAIVITYNDLKEAGLSDSVLEAFIKHSKYLPLEERDKPLNEQEFIISSIDKSINKFKLSRFLDPRYCTVQQDEYDQGKASLCKKLVGRITRQALDQLPEVVMFKETLKDHVRDKHLADWQFDGFAVRADAHTSYTLYRCGRPVTIDLKEFDTCDDLEHFSVLDETYPDSLITLLNKEVLIYENTFKELFGESPVILAKRTDVSAGYHYEVFVGSNTQEGMGWLIQYKNCHYIDRNLEVEESILSLARDFN